METNTRRTHRCTAWLTAAAALAFAAPSAAQPSDTEIRPPQPLPPPKLSTWPDFPAEPLLPPPGGAPKAKAKEPIDFGGPKPVDNSVVPAGGFSTKSVRPAATTSAQLPAFSGFGKGGEIPRAGSFPQPDMPPNSLAAAAVPEKVWTVQPVAGAARPVGLPPERMPRDFGNGFKGVVNQRVLGREGPAAAILPPRNAFGPRPEWGWHGYESFDVSKSGGGIHDSAERANTADMAPFMKYAHQWRPSSIGAALAQANQQQGYAAAPPTMGPAMTPSVTTPAPSTHSVTSEPATRAPMLTPSVTTPLPIIPDAGPIQNTEFRAAPVTGNTLGQPSEPLPPLPRVESKPKVAVVPPPDIGGANRLPLAVRERISGICAGKCRNLAVEMLSPVRLRVAFLVKDQIDAEMLTSQLAGLQELAPYKVDFEVQIGQ